MQRAAPLVGSVSSMKASALSVCENRWLLDQTEAAEGGQVGPHEGRWDQDRVFPVLTRSRRVSSHIMHVLRHVDTSRQSRSVSGIRYPTPQHRLRQRLDYILTAHPPQPPILVLQFLHPLSLFRLQPSVFLPPPAVRLRVDLCFLACGVDFPFAIPTSVCLNSATISSGLYLFIGLS